MQDWSKKAQSGKWREGGGGGGGGGEGGGERGVILHLSELMS